MTDVSKEIISRLVATTLRPFYVEVESTIPYNGVVTAAPTIIDGKSRVYQVRDKTFKIVGHTAEKVAKFRKLILEEFDTTEADFTGDGYFTDSGKLTENGYQAISRLLNNYINKKNSSVKYLKVDTEMWVTAERKSADYDTVSPKYNIIYNRKNPNHKRLAELIVKYMEIPLLEKKKPTDVVEKFTSIISEIPATPKVVRQPIEKPLKRETWLAYNGDTITGGKCFCCKKGISFDNFECGHIVSASHGGKDEVSNYRPVCHECNSWAGGMSSANMYEYMLTHNTEGASSLDDSDPMVLSVKMMIFMTNYVKKKLTENPSLSKTQVEMINNSLNIKIPLLERWKTVKKIMEELL